MCRSELRVVLFDVVARLTDDLEVPYYCVLYKFIVEESYLVQVRYVTVNAFDCFDDVMQVVGKALEIAAYSGRALASTSARKLSGSALGVRTSTGMPSSFLNS